MFDVHLELGAPGGWHPLFARQGKAERKQNTGTKIKSSSRNLENLENERFFEPNKIRSREQEKYMGHIFFIFDNQDLGGMGYL